MSNQDFIRTISQGVRLSGVGGGGRLDLQACNWDTTNWVVNISEGTGGSTTMVDNVNWSETDIQSHFCN